MICEKLRPHLETSSNYITIPVSVEKKVACTLYKLASCAEYRVVGDVFGVHKSTVHKCFYQVVRAINIFKAEYIKFPNEEESFNIAAKFEDISGIGNIIGAIDGNLNLW